MDALHAAAAAASHPDNPQSASIISHLAIESLMPSLRLAHHYVLTVGAQRHPSWLLRWHRYRDEAYLVFAALLEAHSLGRNSASFAELFHGMRRANGSDHSKQRTSVVLQLVVLLLPAYVRAKVDELLADDPDDGRVPPADVDGGASAGADDADINAARNAARASHRQSFAHRLLAKLSPKARAALRLLYRGLCTLVDGGSLLQLLLYVHSRSPYATLAQRFLGFTLRRRTAADEAASATATASSSLGDGSMALAAAFNSSGGAILADPLRLLRLTLTLLFRLLSHADCRWERRDHAVGFGTVGTDAGAAAGSTGRGAAQPRTAAPSDLRLLVSSARVVAQPPARSAATASPHSASAASAAASPAHARRGASACAAPDGRMWRMSNAPAGADRGAIGLRVLRGVRSRGVPSGWPLPGERPADAIRGRAGAALRDLAGTRNHRSATDTIARLAKVERALACHTPME